MAAESDGLALLFPAVGIAAIASLQLDQFEMARSNFDTAKLDSFEPRDSRSTS